MGRPDELTLAGVVAVSGGGIAYDLHGPLGVLIAVLVFIAVDLLLVRRRRG